MITGVVTAHREAVVPVTVLDRDGRNREFQAVIDTGFDGSLTLPSSVIAALGLAWCRRGRVLLADGSESVCDIFEGTVMWDGTQRRIPDSEDGAIEDGGQALTMDFQTPAALGSAGEPIQEAPASRPQAGVDPARVAADPGDVRHGREKLAPPTRRNGGHILGGAQLTAQIAEPARHLLLDGRMRTIRRSCFTVNFNQSPERLPITVEPNASVSGCA